MEPKSFVYRHPHLIEPFASIPSCTHIIVKHVLISLLIPPSTNIGGESFSRRFTLSSPLLVPPCGTKGILSSFFLFLSFSFSLAFFLSSFLCFSHLLTFCLFLFSSLSLYETYLFVIVLHIFMQVCLICLNVCLRIRTHSSWSFSWDRILRLLWIFGVTRVYMRTWRLLLPGLCLLKKAGVRRGLYA